MHKQDIEITIAPNGEVSFTIKGVKGPQCMDETKFLVEALGSSVLVQERTTEYYEQSERATQKAEVGSGEGSDE
jgi:hypothetical protein